MYDAADELTGSSGLGGSVVYGYDGRGDQTSAGGAGYGYDLAGRLTSATVAGATTAYGYDGDGDRLSATTGAATVEYLWDTNNELPELALERTGAGGLLRGYVRGLDTVALLEGGARFYYHHDRLGSVTALTSASGASEWLYSYEPFGGPRTTSQPDPLAPVNPLGFTGQYQDPGSGLLNLRARQYDASTGRFQSTDPAPAGPTDPYTNTYDYAGQNPINEYDLNGECWTGLCWAKHSAEAAYNGAVKPAAHVVGSTVKTVARYTPSNAKQWAQVYSVTETVAATAVAAGATVVILVVVCPAATAAGGPVGAAGCVVAAAGTAALTAGSAYAAVKEAKAYIAEKRRRH